MLASDDDDAIHVFAQDIVLINLRAEPVLFLRRDADMIPYVPTTSDLRVYSVGDAARRGTSTADVGHLTVADIEVALRKEARLIHHTHHDYDELTLLRRVHIAATQLN